MLAQQLAQAAGGNRVRVEVAVRLEDEVPLRPAQLVRPARPVARVAEVAAVPVEVDEVVAAGTLAQVGAEVVERRRAEHGDRRGQVLLLHRFHEGAHNRAVRRVLVQGPGRHQQDVHAVVGQVGEGRRIVHVVETARDGVLLHHPVPPRVAQSLPRPRQHVGIVGGDRNLHVAVPAGPVEPLLPVAPTEEGVERLGAPVFQGAHRAVGAVRPGGEGVLQEVFQVPPELVHQRPVALADRAGVRRRNLDGIGRLAVPLAAEPEPGRIGLGDVQDRKLGHARGRSTQTKAR